MRLGGGADIRRRHPSWGTVLTDGGRAEGGEPPWRWLSPRTRPVTTVVLGVGTRAKLKSIAAIRAQVARGMGAQRAAHSQPREHPRSTPRPRAPCEEATTRTHPCSFPTDPKVSVCVLEPKTTHRPALSIRP